MIEDPDPTMRNLKIMVTGGRTYNDWTTVRHVLSEFDREPKPILIHGNAHGLDNIAATVGRKLGWTIESHPADWERHGRTKAGHIRNHQMINRKPDFCIVFPGGKGTDACRKAAQQKGITTMLLIPDDHAPRGFTLTTLSTPEDTLIPLMGFPDDQPE